MNKAIPPLVLAIIGLLAVVLYQRRQLAGNANVKPAAETYSESALIDKLDRSFEKCPAASPWAAEGLSELKRQLLVLDGVPAGDQRLQCCDQFCRAVLSFDGHDQFLPFARAFSAFPRVWRGPIMSALGDAPAGKKVVWKGFFGKPGAPLPL